MIDITKAKEEFKKYLEGFDKFDEKINLKIVHTFKVVEVARYIAEKLDMDDENVKLAELISLLHDIARFEQITKYNTFIDAISFDHGERGVEILFSEDMYIRKYIETDKYDEVIKKAIGNHNKFKVEKGLNQEEQLHTNIVRDADKTDIFRAINSEDFPVFCDGASKEELENEQISDYVYNTIINNEGLEYSKRETKLDKYLSILTYIYDYNYVYGLERINEDDYLNAYIDRLEYRNEETIKRVNDMKKAANDYLQKAIVSGKII